jgi:putative ABC transport system permease protein
MMGPISRLFPMTLLARRNLTRARARTALATLGIVIGVVAISSLGVFGVAFYQAQVGTFQEALSSVTVSPGEDAEFERFDDARIARVGSAAPEGMPVVGMKSRDGNLTAGPGEEAEPVPVKAIERPREEFVAASGEVPRTWRDGVVVGDDLAAEENLSVGDVVRLDGEPERVRAVLKDDTAMLFSPGDAVFVPFETLEPGYDAAIVRAGSFEAAPRASARMDRRLNVREDRYQVQDFGDNIERIRQQKAQIDFFLLGVGAISMFVAGVSILNVMLMSVMERREEIGVLRAVGYHRLDVLRLILGEAALLGVVGATIGALVSLGVGALINAQLLGDPFAFSPEALGNVAIGVGFGLATSVLSGCYPAWKAANARPVEALRD